MQEAELNGTFDFDPNSKGDVNQLQPNDLISNRIVDDNQAFIATRTSATKPQVQSSNPASDFNENVPAKQPSPPIKRKNSLDEFELEIEGINLDENIDTSVSPYEEPSSTTRC